MIRSDGLHAQLSGTRISIDFATGSLEGCLLRLQKASALPLAYETSSLPERSVQAAVFKNEKLSSILDYLLTGTGYIYEELHGVIVIRPGAESLPPVRGAYRICGTVKDHSRDLPLAGAAIFVPEYRTLGTFTDSAGTFSFYAPVNHVGLQIRHISFETLDVLAEDKDGTCPTFNMEPAPAGLDVMEIQSRPEPSSISALSKVSPDIRKMSFLPLFCGDVDLLGIIKANPGIQQGNDGSGSLIVRGGAPDQHMVLLDGATLYTSGHLLGLVSSIHAAAVKSADIYKGAFPARFGGRLSSFWDIAMKSGDTRKFHGDLSLGTMASSVMLEVPLVKDKTSLLLAGRRSYHDLYLRWSQPGLQLHFQDLNLKFQHKFSEHDYVYYTGYYSSDVFHSENLIVLNNDESRKHAVTLQTKNQVHVFKWKHIFSDRLITNLSFSTSGYNLKSAYRFESAYYGMTDVVEQGFSTGLNDFVARLSGDYVVSSRHSIGAGVSYTIHSFKPSINTSILFQSIDSAQDPNRSVVDPSLNYETDAYVEDNFEITEKLRINAGLHFNGLKFDTGNSFSIQPRVNLCYQPSGYWSVNLSYVRMSQNLHLLTNNLTSLPSDFWIASSSAIRPQSSDQVSLGISGGATESKYKWSVESYYKWSRHVTELLITDTLFMSTGNNTKLEWEQAITQGKAAAYGLEFLLQKQSGRLTGWLGYTLAWSNRTLPEVNDGLTFPYKYDRRHNVNLVLLYKLGKSIELSSVFTFQSKPRFPVLMFRSDDNSPFTMVFRSLISESIPQPATYHRLDMGISWIKENEHKVKRILNLSIFNVYNHRNPAFYYSGYNIDQTTPVLPDKKDILPFMVALSCRLCF
ncbi:TonB-dependent receptor [Taibaiella chishuiensis]|uniref:TonB-dependent receptor n=1 Tax=Taibaiella chishuiensis TaxID=1434707 RepID=UPI0015E780CB|nr:TonB-dependent receptor [Taibaiella chishuiensis]